MPGRLKALLREPLVHFLAAGLALFLFFAWRGEEVDPASRTITITEKQVASLAASWAQTWQRAPSSDELDGLIRDYIKEEVYYREALRLGLDSDDTVIRRRLRAKMEFLARSQAENAVVNDAVLQAWLDRNPARYATDAKISFDQVFLEGSGEKAPAVLARLRSGAKPEGLGDAISLPTSVEGATVSEIKRQFGEEFAAAAFGLEKGDWTGSIRSGFGSHLIRVRALEFGGKPKLADIRQMVENDWRAATAKDREARAYQTLLDSYTIRIQKP